MRPLAMLQGAAQAAQEHGAADSGPDLQGMLMHHLLDGAELEFQVLGVGPVIHLPHFDPVHIGPLTLDLSPTKHVVFLFLSALICLAIFLPIGRAMKNKYSDRAPTGLANAMEAMVLYFRDEVVRRNIGHGADAYTGYILTLFFFILFMNLLGLVPFGATATGNFMVTGALALVTFVVTEISGMRALGFSGYMGTIFYAPKGLNPVGTAIMLVILTPVEFLGKLTKPFALMIRLFANMMAGHTLVLSLLGLIFMFASGGAIVAGGVTVASIAMVSGIMILELFVAFLQAYIFAMLTSVFIGLIQHAH
ncbi:MAG: F0F1 ATP synthase subunit A [Gemmatimonadota bacterium]|nr:F0F1 ATP synthase subunit A [Gemmatimonadota bacterium]MDE3007060.1 F0F1 ATP synthase subunit A [Gemmatimonadota bacterium]MDE3013023.1 F0F1 ATP synthase subunit A [Gemmatimonadota bacterium]